MSGAFNIDIEVGGDGKKIKIYCASLTDHWTAERDQVALAQFHAGLSQEDTVVKQKIDLGPCPKTDNIADCERFLSRLGCTAAVLRISRLHDFLNIPQSVRDGLTYASHKPFGKSVREGFMQRHPRFVRRGGGRRWIRLTKDERGGSLICYEKDSKGMVLGSIKIGGSTQMQNLKDKGIPNAFVLRAGKRQWILQATTNRDFQTWQQQVVNMLKEFGPVQLSDVDGDNVLNNANEETSPTITITTPSSNVPRTLVSGRAQQAQNSAVAGKLLNENETLKATIKAMMQQVQDLEAEIDLFHDKEMEMKTEEAELRRKEKKRAEREREELIAVYEVKQDNLRREIESLHQKLEQKTIDEGGRSGMKSLFGEDYLEVKIEDYKESTNGGKAYGMLKELMEDDDEDTDDDDDDDDDDEEGGNKGRTTHAGMTAAHSGSFDSSDDEATELTGGSSHYNFLHKHLHYHDHKHLHEHRHTHIHDQSGDEPKTYTHTHTIAHTITHTMTQFKIKKRGI